MPREGIAAIPPRPLCYPHRVLPDKRTPPTLAQPRTRRKSPRRGLPAGSGFLLLPFTIFLAAVLLGAIHRWLGEPLGARFAGEVWDLARNLGIMLLTGAPFVAFVGKVNANAIADAKTSALQLPDLARGEEGYDHDNLDDGPPRSQRRR